MKALVLSCSTGEGHNSAAKAIYEELSDKNIKVYMEDILSFGNRRSGIIVKAFFNGVASKMPSLFGMMYKAGALVSNNFIKSPVYLSNLMYANNLNKYIIKNNIDIVVCTHLFPMETLTFLKRKKNLKIKCYGILTDYTPIPFIEETELDGYFIPHEDLIKEFVKKGVSKSIIYPLGIPVSKKFNLKSDKKEARSILGLPNDKNIILIMTGGIGCGNVMEMINSLIYAIKDNRVILVLVGKNIKLKKEIELCFSHLDVMPISFTEKVNLYMDASDVLLSKPGGLSSTEAAVKEIPLIHTMPIPGCEAKNADFFFKRRMSIKAESEKDIVENTIEILKSKSLRNKIITNQNKTINKNASKDIVNKILN